MIFVVLDTPFLYLPDPTMYLVSPGGPLSKNRCMGNRPTGGVE